MRPDDYLPTRLRIPDTVPDDERPTPPAETSHELPALCYIGDVIVGVVSECLCPPIEVLTEHAGIGHYCTVDHPHESHDIVPLLGEDELPEGVDFGDYQRWCRMFAAAPDLLAACKALVNFQKGHENWPEVKAAEAAIAKAEGR